MGRKAKPKTDSNIVLETSDKVISENEQAEKLCLFKTTYFGEINGEKRIFLRGQKYLLDKKLLNVFKNEIEFVKE